MNRTILRRSDDWLYNQKKTIIRWIPTTDGYVGTNERCIRRFDQKLWGSRRFGKENYMESSILDQPNILIPELVTEGTSAWARGSNGQHNNGEQESTSDVACSTMVKIGTN